MKIKNIDSKKRKIDWAFLQDPSILRFSLNETLILRRWKEAKKHKTVSLQSNECMPRSISPLMSLQCFVNPSSTCTSNQQYFSFPCFYYLIFHHLFAFNFLTILFLFTTYTLMFVSRGRDFPIYPHDLRWGHDLSLNDYLHTYIYIYIWTISNIPNTIWYLSSQLKTCHIK